MAKLGGAGSQIREDLGLGVIPALLDPGVGFVGSLMSPMAYVPSASGVFRTLDWDSFSNKNVASLRGSGALPKQIEFGVSSSAWACHRYAYRDYIDTDDIRNEGADRGTVEREIVQLQVRQHLAQLEARVVAVAAGITATSTPAIKWDQANSTIRANIDTATQTIINATGGAVRPNMFAADYRVFDAMRRAAELTGLLGGVKALDEISQDMIVAWLKSLGFEHVGVSTSQQLSDTVYIGYSSGDTVSSLKTTFCTLATPVVKDEIRVWTYNEGGIIDWYNTQIECDELLVHDATGYRLTDVMNAF